jgi:hypothetical protein
MALAVVLVDHTAFSQPNPPIAPSDKPRLFGLGHEPSLCGSWVSSGEVHSDYPPRSQYDSGNTSNGTRHQFTVVGAVSSDSFKALNIENGGEARVDETAVCNRTENTPVYSDPVLSWKSTASAASATGKTLNRAKSLPGWESIVILPGSSNDKWDLNLTFRTSITNPSGRAYRCDFKLGTKNHLVLLNVPGGDVFPIKDYTEARNILPL